MDENHFRVAAAIAIVVTMSIGVYHRWQAARSGERVSRRDEGLLLAVVLRLSGLVMWIGTFAWLIRPQSMAWAMLPLPDAVRWSGAVLGLLGAGLMYWTMTSLGKNLTDTVAVRREAYLVTRGPYRWVRHPFYVTAAVLMASITLLSANALIGAAGLAVVALLAVRTPIEERKLLEQFGEPYRRYRAATGAFLPRLHGTRR